MDFTAACGPCDRYSRVVIRVDGPFIKALGHELAIQHGVSTTGADRDRSLLFFMDTDMFTYPGVINAVLKNTVKDKVRLIESPIHSPERLSQFDAHVHPCVLCAFDHFDTVRVCSRRVRVGTNVWAVQWIL